MAPLSWGALVQGLWERVCSDDVCAARISSGPNRRWVLDAARHWEVRVWVCTAQFMWADGQDLIWRAFWEGVCCLRRAAATCIFVYFQ